MTGVRLVDGLWVHEQPAATEPAAAPVVVLVHGSLDRSASFARVERHLADLTVLRYDRRGYGRSIDTGPASSFDQQVDDLAAVVGDRPAVVVGHSLGGVIGLAFAQHHPEWARAVVAYEAPMSWRRWWPRVTPGGSAVAGDGDPADAAERFMRRMIGDARWERLPPSTREQRRAEGSALVAELRSVRPPWPAPYEPALVTVPVLAACGTGSAAHHRRAPEVLAAEAPNGELHKVVGAGHGVHLTHPAELAALARRALDRAG